jgi:hypothetical protein
LRRIRSKKDLDADGGGEGGVVCSSFECCIFAAAVKISLTPRPRGALDSKYVAWIERANVEACTCTCKYKCQSLETEQDNEKRASSYDTALCGESWCVPTRMIGI